LASNYLNSEQIAINDEIFVKFIDYDEIIKRIKTLAEQISSDYQNDVPVFIGILNGSFIFMADLLKEITIDCEVDFFKLSSYGDSKISSGNVKMLKDLNCDITNRRVVIVEDIVDTGLSIKYMLELLANKKPKDVKIASLLLKPKSLKYDVKIDYVAFEIPSKFVLGYGLDYAQKYRNLKSIYILKEENNDGV
jgi:hypoxanthine phosphoribosyltransferase